MLMGSVTVDTPAGPFQLPDLPTYLDITITQPGIMSANPPTSVTPGLVDFVSNWCTVNPKACAGFSQSAELAKAVAAIGPARSAGIPVDGGGVWYPNTNTSTAPGYVQTPSGETVAGPCPAGMYPYNGRDSGQGCSPTPRDGSSPSNGVTPNVLNTVVPQPTYMNPTPGTNVLNAPTGAPPVTAQQVSQNQGINQGIFAGANALPDLSTETSWVTSNWPLLAAAAVGLYLLTKGK